MSLCKIWLLARHSQQTRNLQERQQDRMRLDAVRATEHVKRPGSDMHRSVGSMQR